MKGEILRLQLLRRVCQKLGLVLCARKYDLSGKNPLQLSDLLDVVPVTKSWCVCPSVRRRICTLFYSIRGHRVYVTTCL